MAMQGRATIRRVSDTERIVMIVRVGQVVLITYLERFGSGTTRRVCHCDYGQATVLPVTTSRNSTNQGAVAPIGAFFPQALLVTGNIDIRNFVQP